MEAEYNVIKRRSRVPSPPPPPVSMPSKSPSANGHYQLLPPSSSSTSPSSSCSVSAIYDFDLTSFKSSPMSYTSLKDIIVTNSSILLPLTPPSPSAFDPAAGGASTLEINIRNRLVKQAAWAYLQPMASSPSASGRRLWSCFTGDLIEPLMSSIKRALVDWTARFCNWFADALWLLLCR